MSSSPGCTADATVNDATEARVVGEHGEPAALVDEQHAGLLGATVGEQQLDGVVGGVTAPAVVMTRLPPLTATATAPSSTVTESWCSTA